MTAAGRRPSLDPSALEHPEEPVTNGAANWAIALEAVLTDRAAVHDAPLVLVDMDAIVANPVERYRGLYDAAGLTWTDKIAASIHAEFSRDRGDNAAPTQDRAHIKARDLSAVNSYWKSLLTEDEAAVVERICGPTWRRVQAAMAEVP